jgi:hypothetical protein
MLLDALLAFAMLLAVVLSRMLCAASADPATFITLKSDMISLPGKP